MPLLHLIVNALDLAARGAGIVMALSISAMAIVLLIGAPWALFNSLWAQRTILSRLMAMTLPPVLGAVLLFFGWRALRFMGGYIGSSEYPFHFAVRWLTGH